VPGATSGALHAASGALWAAAWLAWAAGALPRIARVTPADASPGGLVQVSQSPGSARDS